MSFSTNMVKAMARLNADPQIGFAHDFGQMPGTHWSKDMSYSRLAFNTIKAPAQCINLIFDGTAAEKGEIRIDCDLAIRLAIAKGFIDTYGESKFSQIVGNKYALNTGNYRNGPFGPYLHPWAHPTESELLPGDWVYYQNHSGYLQRHPTGSFQGENGIYYLDANTPKISGYGLPPKSIPELKQALVDDYNNHSDEETVGVPDQINVSDLPPFDPGYVVRFDMSKLT